MNTINASGGVIKSVEDYVSMLDEWSKKEGMPMMASLVRAQGVPMRRIGQRPDGVRKGRAKGCYKNATVLCHRYPFGDKLLYAEGYATSRNFMFPVFHAWCVNTETLEVIDPTWNDGAEYFGWVYQPEFHRKCMLETGVYGIIDGGNAEGYKLMGDLVHGRIPVETWRHPVTDLIKEVAP